MHNLSKYKINPVGFFCERMCFKLSKWFTKSLTIQHSNVYKKRNKAQFFILSAIVIVGILYFISRWLEPHTIIDTSTVASSEELFIFNNIAEKARIVLSTGTSPEELKYNLEEYKAFVENYALYKNIKMDFDISHISFGDPTTGYINITLSSPTRIINKRIDVYRSFS